MEKQRLTLKIEANLIQEMKIFAVTNKTSLTKLTEKLYRERLALSKKRGK